MIALVPLTPGGREQFIAEGWKRSVRLDSLGKAYSAESIEQRFIEKANLEGTMYGLI